MSSTIAIHREFHQYGRIVAGAAATGLVMVAVSASGGLPMSGWRTWAGSVGLILLLGSFMAFGIYRMNRIVLTPDHLEVGRETFERADFDFGFGVQPPLVLSVEEQERIEEEWPLPPNAFARIAGGSWGRRRGTAMLVLKLARSDRLIAIFSRTPTEFDRALTEWLERPPDQSGSGR